MRRLLTVSGTGTINVNSADTVGALSQSGGTIQGTSTLTVTGLYNQSGGEVGGPVTIDGGSFKQSGGATLALGTTVNSTGLKILEGGTIAGTLGGAGATTIQTGITTVSGTITGDVTLASGTLNIDNSNAIGGSITTTGSVINYANGVNEASALIVNSLTTQLSVGAADVATQSGIISEVGGPRPLEKIGTGTLILTGANAYTGATTITAGMLTIGDGGATGTLGSGNVVNNATLQINRNNAVTLANAISGTGALRQVGLGTTTLTGTNTYDGTTLIAAGSTLEVGAGGSTGTLGAGAVTLDGPDGMLRFNRSDALAVVNAIGGAGQLVQAGAGTTTLSGASGGFIGTTAVNAGRLNVSGTLGGAVNVNAGGTLGGTGSIRGGVTVAGGTLSPGLSPGTLTVGSLTLNSGASAFELATAGVAGGATNDLIIATSTLGGGATGNLSLTGGTVTITQGVGFSSGTYTLVQHNGSLTGAASNLTLTALTGGFTGALSSTATSLLLNVASAADFVHWNGSTVAPPLAPGVVGGVGTWNATSGSNFTNAAGTVSGPWAGNGSTAIFGGGAGVVTLGSNVTPASMQFTTTNYTIAGGGFEIQNPAVLTVDTVGALLTSIINAPITGVGSLTKNGAGGLVLSGTNTYGGGTIVNAGEVSFDNSSALGTGNIVLANATILRTIGVGLTLANDIEVRNGTINANGQDLILSGVISNAAVPAPGENVVNFGSSAGISGRSILTNTNTFGIANVGPNATLQVSAGGTNGTLGTGNVNLTDGTSALQFARTDTITVGNVITGVAGSQVRQATTGTTILTGTNSGGNQFLGVAGITAGTLRVNGTFGDTAGNSALVVISTGATLQGTGTIAGNVQINNTGILAAGASPGTLTIAGNLVLDAGSTSNFELGQANTVGGVNNDLVNVGGNLTLDGTLNVTSVAPGFSNGFYRLYNHGGTLTNNTIDIGTLPGGFNAAGTPVAVLTNINGQVNLQVGAVVDQFWDGAGLVGNGVINGGAGTWNAANTNWTNSPGGDFNTNWHIVNGTFAGGAGGAVDVGGAQAFQQLNFTTAGYTLGGAGSLATTGGFSIINTAVDAGINVPIIGAGGLTKIGAGVLSLGGVSTYAGETDITAGTLRTTVGNALPTNTAVTVSEGATLDLAGNNQTIGSLASTPGGTGAVALDTATLITGGNNTSTSFAGIISGTGGLTKAGTGTFTLTGANSYAGITTITAGTLAIGDGGTTGALGSGTVINNATLAFSRSNASTVANTISGTGAVNHIGTGILNLTGNNSFSGGVSLASGTLGVGSDTALGTSVLSAQAGGGTLQALANVSLANNITLTPGITASDQFTVNTNGFNMTLSGIISRGTGFAAGRNPGLTKEGAGNLTLTGTYTYDGATIVNAGKLIVNGTIANSPSVTIANGAAIGGNAAIPNLTVQSSASISPGNSIGVVNIAGNLTLDAGSTTIIEIQQNQSDRINAGGTAAIAGALQLVALGGPYVFASPYTIITATGGRTGTFATVNTDAAFGVGVTSTVTYSPNNVLVTLNAAPLAVPTTLALTRPQNLLSVATGSDRAVAAGGNASPFFAVYNQPTRDALARAVNTLSGEVHTSANAMGLQASDQFLRVMFDPTNTGRNSAFGLGVTGGSGMNAWGAAFGQTGRNAGEVSNIGSSSRTASDWNLAFGADIRVSPNTVVGVAAAGGQATASLAGGLGAAKADIFQFGAYSQSRFGALSINLAGSFATLDIETNRAIPALGAASVKGSYRAHAWSGRAEANYATFTLSGITLSPYAAIQGTRTRTPSFVEKVHGGVAPFSVVATGTGNGTVRTEAGLRFDLITMGPGSQMNVYARTAWAHYLSNDSSFSGSLAGLPGSGFKVTGARAASNSALLGLGADMKLGQSMTLGGTVNTEISPRQQSYSSSVKLNVAF
jgi:fibronectin-binding autotransporter adhesin